MNLEKQSSSTLALRRDKGQAGLTILLSVVAMVFIIGFLVMVFAIIGGELVDNSATATPKTVVGETGGFINTSSYTVDNANAPGFRTFVITWAGNTTSGQTIASGNYTYTQTGVVSNASATQWSAVTFNYTYVDNGNNTATEAIGNTVTAIAGVSSWFPIIITITVMVALILLTVIIIVAIRSSGILAGGQ